MKPSSGPASLTPLSGSGPADPPRFLREIADWCEQNNIVFDNYGSGNLVETFEKKIASLLDFPAARFMPSGTLAQLAALKVWAAESNCPHFGMHPTSHLEIHEEHAYAHLYNLRRSFVGPAKSALLAEHILAIDEKMSALLIELPAREIGGQLPSWDELEKIKATAHKKGIKLHLDGARLWETKPFYNREYSEICAGFDSVYVSFYKGIGALPGAMLLGSVDFIAKATLWQRRAGGTLQTLGPQIASATMLLDKSLRRMPAYFNRMQQVVHNLSGIKALRFFPELPQVNMVHVYLPFRAEIANKVRAEIEEQYSIKMFGNAMSFDIPEESYFELTVGENLLGLSDSEVHLIFSYLIETGIRHSNQQ
ncbi:MAG TPA: threonine aldolase [Porticoccaceae bacterium]|nr:threonine aldolase [Porticoccaceae bacterium]HIK80339.1 threonine aldolase [Porticoccaceae bacterium]